MTIKFKDWVCTIDYGYYSNGRTSILLLDETTFEPICKATVNIPEEDIKTDEVIIKDCHENEGILDALKAVGIVSAPIRFVEAGYNTYPVCILLRTQHER